MHTLGVSNQVHWPDFSGDTHPEKRKEKVYDIFDV